MLYYFLSIQLTGVYLVLIIVMLFFCLLVFKQNKLLKLEIERLKEEQLSSFNKISVKKDNDTVSIKEISKDQETDKCIDNKKVKSKSEPVSYFNSNEKNSKIFDEKKISKRINDNIDINNITKYTATNKEKQYQNKTDINKKIDNIKNTVEKGEKNYYSKNLLNSKKNITSPISINNDIFDIDKFSFDLNEFIKKKKNIVPAIEKKNYNSDYLKDLSKKLATEMEPKIIQLTDYEKKQEESAIISYQELLKVKERICSIDDEDETSDFIEELKTFRSSLN